MCGEGVCFCGRVGGAGVSAAPWPGCWAPGGGVVVNGRGDVW